MKKPISDPAASPDGEPLRSVAIAMASFVCAILLLNGTFLEEGASRLEYGTPAQIFWTRVLRPLDTLSRGSRLSKARETIRDTAGEWLNGEP